MTLYCRSDIAAVTISPDGHGGCGTTHSRPAPGGKPDRLWPLDCPPCENHLRHDPHWSVTGTEVPETYDEAKLRERNEKLGKLDRENQLAAAMIELGKLGNLPEAIGAALASMLGGTVPGQLECPAGHAQPAGQKFCGQCAAPMRGAAVQAAIGAPQAAAEPAGQAAGDEKPRRLRDARLDELQALARDHGVSPDGKRAALIAALSGAGVTSADLARLPAAA